jgi:glycosyltransferase involved in cell wall biosynthesis
VIHAPRIAYFAPEIPAVSAIFVYEELLGVMRRGIAVKSITVRRPFLPAEAQPDLLRATEVLYPPRPVRLVLDGLLSIPRLRPGLGRAFGWLASDMAAVGLHRFSAWKLVFQWLAGARLARILLDDGCTHLHVHFAHTPAQIAMYASAFSGIPFSITAHANDIFERGLLLARKARRSTKMVTVSDFNREFLVSLGIPPEKLAIVRCGVVFGRPPERARRAADTVFRIGTLCRLVEKKGVDDLLRAVAMLRENATPVMAVIVGEGPQREALERMSRELGLGDCVEFAGAMEHGAVVEWLRSLDVFVLACKKDAHGDMDGIPVALMEAMSQEIPAISTRLSGIPELVVHGRTGLLASPADPADLARQLQRLASDPDLRAALAMAGAEHVRTEFSQDVNLDRLLSHICPGYGAPAPSAALASTS